MASRNMPGTCTYQNIYNSPRQSDYIQHLAFSEHHVASPA